MWDRSNRSRACLAPPGTRRDREKYRNRFWATRGQWEHLGGVVVRGEGTPVIDDGDGEGMPR